MWCCEAWPSINSFAPLEPMKSRISRISYRQPAHRRVNLPEACLCSINHFKKDFLIFFFLFFLSLFWIFRKFSCFSFFFLLFRRWLTHRFTKLIFMSQSPYFQKKKKIFFHPPALAPVQNLIFQNFLLFFSSFFFSNLLLITRRPGKAFFFITLFLSFVG